MKNGWITLNWIEVCNMWPFKKTIESKPLEATLPGYSDEGELDVYSPTWKFINLWAETELNKARESNDYAKLTELKTAALRGRIKLLKEIIGLPKANK